MKQKIVVLILAMILVVQLLPVGTAFAATNDSADSKVVRLLEALGIMSLDEQADMFWDETPVKRREIAQIICNIFKIEPQKKEAAMFRDVDEKYRPYVEEVVELGYMKGYDGEHFGPDDYVTNEQLVKVFVTIAGASPLAEAQGGYPYGYV
ncbi:MAG: S-layer homology domain-containing protein, partial [Clostridia bacterium]|nr:S-layer homology domain-containing protein [Clostridia bacterium]